MTSRAARRSGRGERGFAGLAATIALFAASVVQAAPPRLVAVGDLHGDFAAWRAIATDAHLVDAQGRWIGGSATLVQLGDVIDRAPNGRRLMLDLMRLQREARRAGGRVVALVGNHEAMNMTGDLRYVAPDDFAAYADAGSAALRDRAYDANRAAIEAAYRKRDPQMSAEAVRRAWVDATPLGWLEHQAAWSPNGAIGRWVISNPAVAVVDGALFVHGGISATYVHTPVARINAETAKALASSDTSPTSIINDPQGPLWYRGWAEGLGDSTPDVSKDADEKTAGAKPDEAELAQVLTAFGAQRMVIAHTPNLRGVVVSYDGRLIRVDTGISRAYGGVLGYVELTGGQAVPHVVARPPPTGAP